MNVAVGPYPGSQASVAELLALAEEYHGAAVRLLAAAGDALEQAPGRLCALQAIELSTAEAQYSTTSGIGN